MITTGDIQKLAELSRVKIAPEEQESLRSEIESILGYIDQIKKAAKTSTTAKVDAVHNIMREDGEPHMPSEFTEKILSVAPAREDGYLKVKKIL
jgi:aspartyl-tRNA(Asn)/glutamyl-tRNA(Gln) amidotransferase subunit C